MEPSPGGTTEGSHDSQRRSKYRPLLKSRMPNPTKIIGFSTGALAAGDFRRAIGMLADKNVNVEERVRPLSFPSPSAMEQSFEQTAPPEPEQSARPSLFKI